MGITNLMVQQDITSYNPTSFGNTLMLSPHLNGYHSTPSDSGMAKPPSREHFSVLKSIDFIISVKRSRLNARNFDP